MADLLYPVIVRPLSDEDGGGFLALAADLQGCMSDGATPAEAIANVQCAIEEWCDEARRLGREIPAPGTSSRKSKEGREALFKLLEKQDEILKLKEGLLAAQNKALEELRLEIAALKDRESDAVSYHRLAMVSAPSWLSRPVIAIETGCDADDLIHH
ncbi:type II toxin-antitoxin system HicB family antitoxin [Lichenihabitans sp. Uapishka_5]|uniref:type II toxin-antitoxin system HicB family antitoxin n=1 Tax=Lichenihabitans sp. Uapishka_5 TaxID=3037302 RepID=UPI0029E7E9E7|nr:type II toxin-antitoxin system HicB family antitoxin [Lichenihabitans sp. Uapishka_5]MDX7952198.1 type II toxin-antitoxin system HicB family antitoxin [Lichenihabitans sp. Uapishka_5]